MKRFFSLTLCLAAVAFAGSALAATTTGTADQGSKLNINELRVAQWTDDLQLYSSSSSKSLRFKQAAGPDTFAIYGYTDRPVEGKFQDANGTQPDQQGWYGVDRSDAPVYWQISTVNAANLSATPNNHAAWSGQTAAQQPGFVAGQGYGNSWNDILLFKSGPVPDADYTVTMDFMYNYESEPNYDYFVVQYDSAGTWKNLLIETGANTDSTGTLVAQSFAANQLRDISFNAGGYGGDNGDEVVIRFRGISDSGWSDQDGDYPTANGICQVDDIQVNWNGDSNFEDFEGGSFNGKWLPDKAPFAGDFSHVVPKLTDIDPCRDNTSPNMSFIDEGQVVNNFLSCAQIPGYPTHTSGATSTTWGYGVPNGWVCNYNGGLSNGASFLYNEVWSPEILWDLPGMADDDSDISGGFIRWSMWNHLPEENGMYFIWSIRNKNLGSSTWGGWQDSDYVYYGSQVGAWSNIQNDVTTRLSSAREYVQMAIGVIDLADAFGSPGNDATPSPTVDNAAFVKYRIKGPSINATVNKLSNDGFPVNGSIDASTPTEAAKLDIPFDMAQDISGRVVPGIDTGDSVVVEMIPSLPGTEIADARMFWILDRNPFFDAYRTMPAGGLNENVQDLGGGQWSGEVVADTSKTATGVAIADRYFFTLPDTDFLYPGDELRFYFQATDDAMPTGNVTTLPVDVSGFATGSPWSINFTVHGLPSIKDDAGTQPSKLVLNDSGFTFAINSAMAQLGFVPGTDFDTYWTMGQSSGLSNSIGSGGYHGAIADQLANYDTILYLGGNVSGNQLSDGNGLVRDYADDISLITAWHALSGPRRIAYFGDYLASGPGAPSTGYAPSFTLNTMGLTVVDVDVRDEIDNQTAPLVRPLDGNFSTEFAAYGGCLGINEFDSIRAAASSTRGHGFVDPVTDMVYADVAASVIYDRLDPPITGDRKVDMTFPYSLIYVYDTNGKAAGSTSARAELLREIFGFFGVPSSGTGTVIGAPAAKAISMAVYPNPFNPQTTVKFANLPEKAVGSVKVYNLRGELVATLHSGEFNKPSFVWNGTDSSGSSVASGVYMIEGQAAGFREVVKVALVK